MGTSFSQLSDQRNVLLHTCATWQELAEHLVKFIGSDAAPPKVGITTLGEGLTVPVDIVEAVEEEIQTRIAELKAECQVIEQTLMEDHHVSKKQSARKKEAQSGKGTESEKEHQKSQRHNEKAARSKTRTGTGGTHVN